jgi:hypothetical protein
MALASSPLALKQVSARIFGAMITNCSVGFASLRERFGVERRRCPGVQVPPASQRGHVVDRCEPLVIVNVARKFP